MVVRKNILVCLMGVGLVFNASAGWEKAFAALRNKFQAPRLVAVDSFGCVNIRRVIIESPEGFGPIAHTVSFIKDGQRKQCPAGQWAKDSGFRMLSFRAHKNCNNKYTLDISAKLFEGGNMIFPNPAVFLFDNTRAAIDYQHKKASLRTTNLVESLDLSILGPYTVTLERWPQSWRQWFHNTSRPSIIMDERNDTSTPHFLLK